MRRWLALALGCASLALLGCGAGASEEPLRVFAASSLTEVFEELALGFERAHPEAEVELSFAGSQVLRLQIEEGAPADLFASANEDHMRALLSSGDVERSVAFAANELAVIVPGGAQEERARIERFEQLSEAERIVIGDPEVPEGRYTRALLERARGPLGEAFVASVREHVVSEESNVRLVRAKVRLGEADAAVVYRTDARAADGVRVVPIPEALNVRARYVIGALSRSRRRAEAELFVAYLRSEEGQQVLGDHGFLPAGDPGEAP